MRLLAGKFPVINLHTGYLFIYIVYGIYIYSIYIYKYTLPSAGLSEVIYQVFPSGQPLTSVLHPLRASWESSSRGLNNFIVLKNV
jgi:hypothetical protein